MERNFRQKDYKIDEWGLINMETQEIIELKTGKLTVTSPTGQVRVSSKSYVYLDIARLRVLRACGMTDVELGMLILMASNLSFEFNVCMTENNIPHGSLSISHMMGQSQQAVLKKLKRLIDLGVLSKAVIPNQKHLGKVYMINPYFIRRGKNFSGYLVNIFNDIVKQ